MQHCKLCVHAIPVNARHTYVYMLRLLFQNLKIIDAHTRYLNHTQTQIHV